MSAHILNLLFSHLILSQLTPATCILYYFCSLQCVLRISLTKTLCSCSSYHMSSVIRLHLCGLRKHLLQFNACFTVRAKSYKCVLREQHHCVRKIETGQRFLHFPEIHFKYMRIEAERERSQLLHKLELHPRPAIMFGS